jgi:hypothetical protein
MMKMVIQAQNKKEEQERKKQRGTKHS